MLEIVGIQDNEKYKPINVQDSIATKIFAKTSDIASYNESISADNTYTYLATKTDNIAADISFMQQKYGRIR